MSDVHDWNTKIIEEFRANEGKVGGPFAGAPVLLLHTTAAKTGRERVHPMMYLDLTDTDTSSHPKRVLTQTLTGTGTWWPIPTSALRWEPKDTTPKLCR